MEFTVTQTITRERLSDVLCSALEGGSNYWLDFLGEVEPTVWEFDSDDQSGLPTHAEVTHYLHDYPLNPGGALLLGEHVDDEHGEMRLDAEALQRGLTLLSQHMPQRIADILNEDDDAETADVFLQYCLFGEVLYG